MSRRRLRCAIYTRKSTEEGLDQEFNSLDAQREACEAFIKSQRHDGWTLLPDRYDDGGLSGATMDRPALQRLLEGVGAGRVDVIVVYKVDRLTRALSDFAKMVDIFDEHGVSFVSVTQQFNTTSSMGRLTLNVLLSFAQFEREVTAERIRDKIAASKKKGMWMGGVVPLGYDALDKHLVVNPAETETVRTLFRLYLELGNVRAVKQAADGLGLRTKRRKPNNGARSGGEPFTRGHIYKLLANPLHVGEVVHKGERHPGEHEGIIDRGAWDRVQEQLRTNAVRRRSGSNAKVPSLLSGLLIDGDGGPMVASHASKAGRRYRYYISRSLADGSAGAGEGWRIGAEQIDRLVLAELSGLMREAPRLIHLLRAHQASASRHRELLSKADTIAEQLRDGESAARRAIILQFVARVGLEPNGLEITLSREGLASVLGGQAPSSEAGECSSEATDEAILRTPVALRRRGVELKLVVSDGRMRPAAPDPKLVAAVAKPHSWLSELREGSARSIRELARRLECDRADLGRQLRLAFLAPDIVEAILEGRQPVDLTMARLKCLGDLPMSWSEQRKLLGFHR